MAIQFHAEARHDTYVDYYKQCWQYNGSAQPVVGEQ